MNVQAVELHTGAYANATGVLRERELDRLVAAAELICRYQLQLHAGHGLTYQNVQPIARIPQMHELNIGHSIVARAIMVGMLAAVREMKQLIVTA